MRPINADTLRNKVHKAILEIADTPLPKDYASKLAVKMGEVFRKLIDEEPTIDAEPVRHGRWEHLGGDEWCCSYCGEVIHTEGSWEKPEKKRCSECGAKMSAGEEE